MKLIEQNLLYNGDNRYLNESILLEKMGMTYIVGARCKDGVVLIGDQKVTLEGGADYDFEDKIFRDIPNIIVGSSGASGLFDKFRSRVGQYVATHTQGVEIQAFISEIENITKALNDEYRERLQGQYFDVLLAVKLPQVSALQYIHPFGFAEGVRKYKAIGHGEPYGSVFLKCLTKLWHNDVTMEQFAELGYFIIRYIDEFKLDNTVGGDPQIWFIPDGEKNEVHQADPEMCKKLKDKTEKRLKKLGEDINSLFTDGAT
jgi:20S proteasome alpha/beta subunit